MLCDKEKKMKPIKYLRVLFQPEISAAELVKFRGAIIGAVEREAKLFHNHLEDDRLRYGYPLIQYKRQGGKPVLVCLNEGTEEIHALFQRRLGVLQLGDREVEFKVASLDLQEWRLEVSPQFFRHGIRNWLALNGENYERYRALSDDASRRSFLARILRGNILAMAKGLDWFIEQEVLVTLHDFSGPRRVPYKDATLMSFDAVFSCNISLPSGIGLGKGAARGFGVVRKIREYVN